MAFDAFIIFDGIEGESTDDKHPGWIEVLSCGMEIQQAISTTASSAGGATAERADFGDFHFTKHLDKATPKLALASASGKHFDNIKVELCRAGTEKVKFMEYNFSNSIISSICMHNNGEFPTETLTLHYAKVQWSYTQQKRKGGMAAGNTVAGWDLQKNCKV